jgi:hypothetical protein
VPAAGTLALASAPVLIFTLALLVWLVVLLLLLELELDPLLHAANPMLTKSVALSTISFFMSFFLLVV